MSASNTPLILRTVEMAAKIILENGGETYRVEETVERMCAPFGLEKIDVFALPTGILISLGDAHNSHTSIKRIPVRTVNLDKVDQANVISRKVSAGEMPLEDAYLALRQLLAPTPERRLRIALASGLTAGCFTVVFGGGIAAFLVASISGFLIRLLNASLERAEIPSFVYSLVGGLLAALLGHGGAALFGLGDTTAIVSGTIMPMLPGLAITNAIRDTMRGDLVSGMARLGEALLVSVALAAGAGIALSLLLGGGA